MKRSRVVCVFAFSFALVATACGGPTPGNGAAETDTPDAGSAPVAPSSEPGGTSDAAARFDAAALCDALDTERIAAILGATVQGTENADQTVMGDPVGYCQIMLGPAHSVRIRAFARADDRFVVLKGGGVTVPLLEEPNVRPIPDVGDRAGAIWANADFESAANNVRAVAVDFGGVAVNVTYVGEAGLHSADELVQVARQVQTDLGL